MVADLLEQHGWEVDYLGADAYAYNGHAAIKIAEQWLEQQQDR